VSRLARVRNRIAPRVAWTLGRVASRWPRPLVLDGQQNTTVEVDGCDLDRPLSRVAILAHWATTSALSHSMCTLVGQLRASDYDIVVVSTAEVAGPLDWHGRSIPDRVSVLRRPNVGYDFGSWATALDRYPQIARAEKVLLINDSLVGPFQPIGPLLESFHGTRSSVWGVTESSQSGRHLQSYALGFSAATLTDPEVQRFWRCVRDEVSKPALIWRNEIGLSRLLLRRGLSIEAAFSPEDVGSPELNPSINGWRRLLDLGFPFVKRELLTNPSVAADALEVPEELKNRYDVDVADWL
jgi:lipopolysaccharide biosynthesis protein